MFALVVVVDSATDGFGRVFLSGATDLIDIRCIEGFIPKQFDAVIYIKRFSIFGRIPPLLTPFHRHTSHSAESQVLGPDTQEAPNLIFEDIDANIVDGGPYPHTGRDR